MFDLGGCLVGSIDCFDCRLDAEQVFCVCDCWLFSLI